MNYVDFNWEWLLNRIAENSPQNLFEHMKNKYLALPIKVRKSIESFLGDFGYWGKLDFQNNDYEQIWNKVDTFYTHLNDLKWLYTRLGDYRSKKLLFAILYNWYDYDFSVLKELMDLTFCHYFDLDLISCHNEVFVDIGAYIGDTVLDFINSYGENSYKKIYCYEMTKDTFQQLTNNLDKYKNIECRCKAISDKNETLHMSSNLVSSSANVLTSDGDEVMAVSIDLDVDDKITMIKMDIEGSEAKAIIGAKNHIINDHPKLLISVYHNHEDIWKIPKMIEEIAPGYTFYLRFYGSNIFPTEIVLIGIYQEKKN